MAENAEFSVYTKATGVYEKKVLVAETFLKAPPKDRIQIVFADWEVFEKNPTLKTLITENYGYPHTLWEKMCHLSNGYGGCTSESRNGAVIHTSWFHFLIKQLEEPVKIMNPAKYVWKETEYEWYEMSFFIHSREAIPGSTATATLFCIKTPKVFQDRVIEILNTKGKDAPPEPLAFLQSAVVQVTTELYDKSIWTLRNHIRAIEKRSEQSGDTNSNFRELHDLARHIIHKCEILRVSVDTVDELVEGSRSPLSKACSCQATTAVFRPNCPHNEMRFWQRMMKNFGGRADSLNLRLTNEINLGFNVVVQRDSKASIETSKQTMEISRATKSDSASMKTVAFVTLAFLPATFVSTVFSMSFFELSVNESGQQDWAMSNKFWIYWAFSAPLTIVTLLLWAWTQRKDILRWWRERQIRIEAEKKSKAEQKADKKADMKAEQAKAVAGGENGAAV